MPAVGRVCVEGTFRGLQVADVAPTLKSEEKQKKTNEATMKAVGLVVVVGAVVEGFFHVPAVRRPLPRLESTFGTVAEAALDTFEDAVMHVRRLKTEEKVRKNDDDDDDKEKQRVVILGSGWGAHAMMKVIDAQQFDVTVTRSPASSTFF